MNVVEAGSPRSRSVTLSPTGSAVVATYSLALLFYVASDWTGGYGLKVGGLAGLLVLLLVLDWRRIGHPVSPVGVLSLGSLLVFVLRPITIATLKSTSPGAAADSRPFVGAAVDAGVLSLNQVIVFFVALTAAYLFGMRYPDPPPVAGRNTTDVLSLSRLRAVLVGATGAAALLTVYLVRSSGGLGAFLSGLSVRSSFLSGRFFLTLGYLPLAAALVVYLLARRRSDPSGARRLDALARIALVVLIVSAFTGGGRGPLLLGVLVPLLGVRQLGSRPLRTVTLMGLGFALVVGAMVMSLVLRENVYTHGQALENLRSDPVGALETRLTSGAETRPFDSLVLLNEEYEIGSLPVLGGSTYLDVPTWFLPGSVVGSKGGGNAWFTKRYVPRFYYPDHIETSISAVGEAFANFRWWGVVAVGLLTGGAASAISRKTRRTVASQARFVLLTPLFVSFARGDAYQNVPLVLIELFLVWLVTAWCRVRTGDESAGDMVEMDRSEVEPATV